ncbi:MAG TPA: hypothetical protein PK649_01350 [Vicingus sp.]|nr:hypothetical protein [Vicingus sp.]
MKNLIKILSFLLVVSAINPVLAQYKQLDIHSKILSKKDSSVIGFVHIINLTTKHRVISDYNGEFHFTVNENDTIKLSVLGYEQLKLNAKMVPSTIYLSPKNYELDEFTVIPYKDFEEFKEAFINLVIIDTTLKMNQSLFMFEEDLFLFNNNGRFGVVVQGPISSLYDYFSKRGKSKKRYEELLAKEKYKSYLATKYNNKLVAEVTKLDDEKKIDEFMKYCNFTDEFIYKSNDYDIIKAIQDNFKTFSEK